MRLRIAHVVAGLDPVYGGPSYSVPRLCRALAAAGAEPTLLSVASPSELPRERREDGYPDHRLAQDYAALPLLRGLRCSAGLSRALADADFDLVHNHGLWLMPNVAAGRAARRAQRPYLVSPRGMLSEAALAFSRTKKRLFWRGLQGPIVRRATCLHATSMQEHDEIRALGLNNPVAVIPNGIDILEEHAQELPSPGAHRCVLSLGRLHPKKGLDRLLHAWAAIEPRHPGWRLRIAGPDEAGHADALRGLVGRLGLAQAAIEPPLYDDAKWQAYRGADLFVLPSRNENFGLTVAEALAAGTPVIATKGAPWGRLAEEGCGWWVDHGVAPLAAALEAAMAQPPAALRRMGSRGRAWMARDFSWERAAHDLLAVYEWLLAGGAAPPSLHLDPAQAPAG